MTDLWQLIAHLLGDYVLQNQWMAAEKVKRWLPAIVHAIFYTIPFAAFFGLPYALIPICLTHLVIDRYRLAGYWCRFWGIGQDGWLPKKLGLVLTGDAPPFLGVWLLILVDNTLHLIINALSLRFLG